MRITAWVGSVLLVGWLGCSDQTSVREKQLESQKAEHSLRAAEAAAQQAVKDAQQAKERLETVMRELDALDVKLTAALTAMDEAQNDADRAAAKAKLKQLQIEQSEMKLRIAEARAAAERADRRRGTKTTHGVETHCLDNPFAKGCS